MTDPTHMSRAVAQKAGWFSRRHRTDEPHRAAVALWKLNHSRKARQRRAAERRADALLAIEQTPEVWEES